VTEEANHVKDFFVDEAHVDVVIVLTEAKEEHEESSDLKEEALFEVPLVIFL
jgi:hypothetical protein